MKLVIEEPGSDAAWELWGSTRVTSSQLLYPEACAAVGRAHRSGRLSVREAREAYEEVQRLVQDAEEIHVTETIVRRAGALAREAALRAYDAVHLASFEAVSEEATLVSRDGDLLRAARALGYSVAATG